MNKLTVNSVQPYLVVPHNSMRPDHLAVHLHYTNRGIHPTYVLIYSAASGVFRGGPEGPGPPLDPCLYIILKNNVSRIISDFKSQKILNQYNMNIPIVI